jgi:hypothetical protein
MFVHDAFHQRTQCFEPLDIGGVHQNAVSKRTLLCTGMLMSLIEKR